MFPFAGVPVIVAVPLRCAVKYTPRGMWPVLVTVAAGDPVVRTVNEPPGGQLSGLREDRRRDARDLHSGVTLRTHCKRGRDRRGLPWHHVDLTSRGVIRRECIGAGIDGEEAEEGRRKRGHHALGARVDQRDVLRVDVDGRVDGARIRVDRGTLCALTPRVPPCR